MWQSILRFIASVGSSPESDGPVAGNASGAAPVLGPDPAFEPVHGWILVASGSLEQVRDALADYDQLAGATMPARFTVELHAQPGGGVVVALPGGLPAYDLANLTGWLSAPPDQPGVAGARVWLTSPGDGLQYALEPELENEAGDTLVGARSDGLSVRVYLPDTGMSDAGKPIAYHWAPETVRTSAPTVVELTLDTDTSFGNPRFILDTVMDWD